MSSGEERLEEMLKAVMETKDEAVTDASDPSIMNQDEESPFSALPDVSDEISGELSEELIDGISDGLSEETMDEILDEISEELIEENVAADKSQDVMTEAEDAEMLIDPLALLDMSEEEVDQVLEKEAGIGETVLGRKKPSVQEEEALSDLLGEDDALSDIQDLLSMSDNHEQVSDGGATEDLSIGEVDLDSESVQNMLGLTQDADYMEESKENEEVPIEKEPAKEKKEKKKRGKKGKGDKDSSPDGAQKKEGFGKKLARLFFGSDEDELESGEEAAVSRDEDAEGKKNVKAAKPDKKKKEKKKKPEKKKEADPQKAAKEKQKKAKNAEKAKKKAEKAEIAEKERRSAKKLPKKKVIVWVLLCASIAAGILLMNSVGMETMHLTEARNAFYDKDFETVYELLNGGELSEEDQLLFQQSSAILHLKHAEEVYENHLKLNKPVMALEDLLKGVEKYQGLLNAGQENLVTPELTAEYQSILKILQEKYGLSEESVREINALDSDYEFSLQLEAIVNGEVYQSQSEIEQQEEETAVTFPEMEDMLPEEAEYLEEFLNDSSN